MKYNKQRNLCVSITRKAKGSYYENLHLILPIVRNFGPQ